MNNLAKLTLVLSITLSIGDHDINKKEPSLIRYYQNSHDQNQHARNLLKWVNNVQCSSSEVLSWGYVCDWDYLSDNCGVTANNLNGTCIADDDITYKFECSSDGTNTLTFKYCYESTCDQITYSTEECNHSTETDDTCCYVQESVQNACCLELSSDNQYTPSPTTSPTNACLEDITGVCYNTTTGGSYRQYCKDSEPGYRVYQSWKLSTDCTDVDDLVLDGYIVSGKRSSTMTYDADCCPV